MPTKKELGVGLKSASQGNRSSIAQQSTAARHYTVQDKDVTMTPRGVDKDVTADVSVVDLTELTGMTMTSSHLEECPRISGKKWLMRI